MTITVNTKTYTLDTNVTKDIVAYNGPAATFALKDGLTLKRTAPKPTTISEGFAKSEAKFTRSVAVGALYKDAIVYVGVSLPVGMAKADADALRADIAALVDGTNGDDLMWKHDVNQ